MRPDGFMHMSPYCGAVTIASGAEPLSEQKLDRNRTSSGGMRGGSTTLTMARTNDPPLVAITTPVYNGERYLGETMACVQAQTYPNLVHLVVDNASTDRSAEIIDS